jgi:hypothetical protein
MKPHEYTEDGVVLFLRRCNKDYTSYGGFQWPSEVGSVVEAPDWKQNDSCGNGLHGWPWGIGLGEGMSFDIIHDSWIVFSAKPGDVVGGLSGGHKAKVKSCVVVASGSFGKCWDVIDKGRDRLIKEVSNGGCEAASSGNSSTAASSGNYSKAASSGNYSKAASSGDSSKAASSGGFSTAASSGDCSTAASSGDYSTAASSGDSSKAASSGGFSTAASSGNSSKAASSGDYSTAASSGNSSKAASSGDYSTAASSGNSSKAASSGGFSTAEAIGESTMASVCGISGRVKVGSKGAFAIGYKREDGSLDFLVGRAGDNVKPDTWYEVVDFELKEVSQ